MTNKTKTFASETKTISGILLLKEHLSSKSKILKSIPENVISNLQNFAKRNALVEIGHCCPHCLKAHAIKTAENKGLDGRTIQIIKEEFKGEIGHNGYYMDEDQLIRL